ncbi:Trypsin-like peptidase domain protein [uncultured archaeon]|nr:Trypsin-like peptidase domain protein [uncultured archaeon]
MKMLLTFALLVAAVFSPTAPAKTLNIREKLAHSTLVVYEGKQVCKWTEYPGFFDSDWEWGCEFKSRFTCTATVIGRGSETDYVALTAGHCFKPEGEHAYYVAEELADHPVLHEIKIIKAENDDRYDYAVITFRSHTEFQPIEVDLTSPSPVSGTTLLNVNFALGLTKQVVEGPVVSNIITQPIERMKPLVGRYLVAVGTGPGASGSALVNPVTGKIVGIVEIVFPATQMPTAAMPTGKTLYNFLEDDSAGLKPRPPQGKPPEPSVPPTPDTLGSRIDKLLQDILDWLKEN